MNDEHKMTMGDGFHAVRRRLKKMAEGVLSEMAGATASEEDDVVVAPAATPLPPPHPQQQQQEQQQQEEEVPETGFEFYSDGLLATAFLITAIIAAKR